ncbi:hypothetical protein C6P45_002290 [Maudiozyma exigua]|uniref:PHD-type domain-containing protein n=1 Tax=Maudiozyma exigua TaxID=34358 RepID=A0A9P7B3S4_MAUEX|nr:hypothetical protein C6P45_002290 [Kazachstania exigua]
MDQNTSQQRNSRPKRSSSLNVNYDLKKRKIIPDYKEDSKLKQVETPIVESSDNVTPQEDVPLYIYDKEGNIIGMNDTYKENSDINSNSNSSSLSPSVVSSSSDILNKATGLPLNQGPTPKIKKESLWNYKKSNNGTLSTTNSDGHIKILKTQVSNNLTKPSTLRFSLTNQHNEDTTVHDILLQSPSKQESLITKPHVKIKSAELKNSQLFNTNILDKKTSNSNSSSTESSQEPHSLRTKKDKKKVNYKEEKDHDDGEVEEEDAQISTVEEDNAIENDDFCSSCLQTGSFLCCDTCPKSFHFLCLDPPVDPNNLPEGDWSCNNCKFKKLYPNQTQFIKGEREFNKNNLVEYETKGKPQSKLFSKLFFQSESYNPRQFSLPKSIKDTFQSVKTGDRGQYSNSKEKPQLPFKVLFNAPYGQSVSKLDSYCPENHYVDDTPTTTGEEEEFLLCYRCGTTRFGTWQHPEDLRLLIKCDYCNTPWHLDCLPDVPRASLKNLGLKWKCPLHADTQVKRRLKRKTQHFYKPNQSCNFKNNGDIEIELDIIRSEGSRGMNDHFKKVSTGEDNNTIPILEEKSIQLDFVSKIYDFHQNEKYRNYKMDEILIDKLLKSGESKSDILPLLYFNAANHKSSKRLKKLWDFKELCSVASKQLGKDNTTKSISDLEIEQLHFLKKLIESKPKDEILKFFSLDQ